MYTEKPCDWNKTITHLLLVALYFKMENVHYCGFHGNLFLHTVLLEKYMMLNDKSDESSLLELTYPVFYIKARQERKILLFSVESFHRQNHHLLLIVSDIIFLELYSRFMFK